MAVDDHPSQRPWAKIHVPAHMSTALAPSIAGPSARKTLGEIGDEQHRREQRKAVARLGAPEGQRRGHQPRDGAVQRQRSGDPRRYPHPGAERQTEQAVGDLAGEDRTRLAVGGGDQRVPRGGESRPRRGRLQAEGRQAVGVEERQGVADVDLHVDAIEHKRERGEQDQEQVRARSPAGSTELLDARARGSARAR